VGIVGYGSAKLPSLCLLVQSCLSFQSAVVVGKCKAPRQSCLFWCALTLLCAVCMRRLQCEAPFPPSLCICCLPSLSAPRCLCFLLFAHTALPFRHRPLRAFIQCQGWACRRAGPGFSFRCFVFTQRSKSRSVCSSQCAIFFPAVLWAHLHRKSAASVPTKTVGVANCFVLFLCARTSSARLRTASRALAPVSALALEPMVPAARGPQREKE
jgi:hypothetical protein